MGRIKSTDQSVSIQIYFNVDYINKDDVLKLSVGTVFTVKKLSYNIYVCLLRTRWNGVQLFNSLSYICNVYVLIALERSGAY